NWVREAQRFAPQLRPILYRETDREATLAALGPNDLLITSYGLVVRHAAQLAEKRFATLVLDEAQAVKNAATRRSRAIRDLNADWRVALTGTPLENHLGELWSLFRVLTPGLLGSWDSFRERFVNPIERQKSAERLKALGRVARPFILRRTKAEVAPELPARTEIRNLVSLSEAERRTYDDARLAAIAQLAGQTGDEQNKRFETLAAITRLRQLACHPKLYDPYSKLPSSKLSRLLELVEELKDSDHRALIFSQFTSHLALVREALDARSVRYLYLDGQTPEAERVKRVDAFQAGKADLFLISLKAGGTGLNLTAADYVVHLDPWWNPAVEDQATDRAHRIGQTRPVTVYRLISKGTIEEAILALHEDKRDLVAGVLDGAGTSAKLSNDELLALIRAGESGPDLGSDDEGEEAVAAAIENLPAGPRTPALPPALAEIATRFRSFLEAQRREGRLFSDGPLKSYPRAIERFLSFTCQQLKDQAETASLPHVLELAEAYQEALRRKTFAAPESEPTLARSAITKLRELARSEGQA
ncbi:MAG: DEAD/DEAH box helicase, partial [Deltaproteobacteria bacterium]|nr:DEAD/DEAH box helicase [Deltaproteobacteria bacterium]